MTIFLNAINGLRHPEEARNAVSKDATKVLQPSRAIFSQPFRMTFIRDGICGRD
jgi:hypothetical protein